MTRPPAFWGVDPGISGAAILLDHDGLTALWHVRCRGPVPPALPLVPGDVVAIEAQHARAGRPGSLALSEWCGRLLAALPPDVVVLRPHPATWRRVIGASGLRRAQAKARAVRAAREHGRGLPERLSADHAEAWAIARWAWAWDGAGRPAGPGVVT